MPVAMGEEDTRAGIGTGAVFIRETAETTIDTGGSGLSSSQIRTVVCDGETSVDLITASAVLKIW